MSPRLLVTRPQQQNKPLIDALMQAGIEPVALPLIDIKPYRQAEQPQACNAIITQVQNLADYQHLICISTNAAHEACYWVDQYWPQLPARQHWYAIGNATAATLAEYDIAADMAGKTMNSESLLEHPQLQNLQNQKVLIFRGKGGRSHLKDALQARGAEVDYCEVYERCPREYPKGQLEDILSAGLDFLSASSGQTIDLLLDLAIIEGSKNEVLGIPIIVPGKRLEQIARAKGFQHVAAADNAGLQAMMETIQKITKKGNES